MSTKTTVDAVNALIPETRTYCVIGDLGCAVLGGRIPKWVKMLADTMRMTPILRTTSIGEIKLATCLFGRSNIAERFAKYVARQTDDSSPVVVAIGHAVHPTGLETVEATLRKNLENIQRVSIGEIGTAIGVHGGPGTLVVSTAPYVSPESLAE